jgi:hypothetical protein
MGFRRRKGVAGLVYVPEEDGGPKKHPCSDCHFCQWCSDERCALCLKSKARSPAGGAGDGKGRRGRKKP